MKIDWDKLPYSHSWEKNISSIFDPSSKITFPQYITEMVLFNRERYVKGFPKIPRGPGWSSFDSKLFRSIVQQACVIVNYFPHPTTDPLVAVAFRNVFRTQRVCKIGQFRKNRNITQDEKDIVKSIMFEYEKLCGQRDIIRKVQDTRPIIEKPTFKQQVGKGRFNKLIEIENGGSNTGTV